MVQIHPDPLFIGGVAQLGERLLCKQEVIGSIPFTSTNSGLTNCGKNAEPSDQRLVLVFLTSRAVLIFKKMEEVK